MDKIELPFYITQIKDECVVFKAQFGLPQTFKRFKKVTIPKINELYLQAGGSYYVFES